MTGEGEIVLRVSLLGTLLAYSEARGEASLNGLAEAFSGTGVRSVLDSLALFLRLDISLWTSGWLAFEVVCVDGSPRQLQAEPP